MKKSESIKEIATALSKFQTEVENPKNIANNPFFNSKYAPLDEIIKTIRPILGKNGLSFSQSLGGDGANITVTTLLMHSSGEWIEHEPFTLKTDKPTAQGAGSSTTYGRRYSLTATLGICSEDDDDGNYATHGVDKPKIVTKEQAEQIRKLALEKKISEEYICKFKKVNKFEDLKDNEWKSAMEWLNKK